MSAAAAESQLAKRPRTEEPDGTSPSQLSFCARPCQSADRSSLAADQSMVRAAVGGEAVKMAKTTVDAVYL